MKKDQIPNQKKGFEQRISRRAFLKATGIGTGALSIYVLSGYKIPEAFGKTEERFIIAEPSEMNTFDPMATVDLGRAFKSRQRMWFTVWRDYWPSAPEPHLFS